MTAPPFAYFGGKTRLADRIVALLPPHEHYVEPFAGSLAVLLAKPRSRMETVNDLDGDLMTFWRVLRDCPDELAAVCALTPHSRTEHQDAYALDGAPSDLERARRVWTLLSQGRGGLLYVDPPYLGSTRLSGGYRHDMKHLPLRALDHVLDDHRLVAVNLGESRDVPHRCPRPLSTRVGLVEQRGLFEPLRAFGVGVVGAFRRRPQDRCAAVAARLNLGDVRAVMLAVREVQSVRLDRPRRVIRRQPQLDTRHRGRAEARATRPAEEVRHRDHACPPPGGSEGPTANRSNSPFSVEPQDLGALLAGPALAGGCGNAHGVPAPPAVKGRRTARSRIRTAPPMLGSGPKSTPTPDAPSRSFPAWLMAMECLGYDHHIVWLNSMHAPAITAPRAPQSRDRMYVVFWRKGNRRPDLEIRPLAWCPLCDREVAAVQVFKPRTKAWPLARWGRYRTQYLYRCPTPRCHATVEPYAMPAAEVIDWSDPGVKIGERVDAKGRPDPLEPTTIARIEAGLRRWAIPQLVPAGGTWNDEARPVTDPFRARTTRETEGLLVPTEGPEAPMRTQTARHETALVVPYYTNGQARPADRPLPTMATVDTAGLAFMVELRGDPSPDTTAGHQSLVGWSAEPPDIEDCTFRMLTVPEIQAAMAFTPEYLVTGNKREQVRQLGNGVTPPAAEWLIRAVVESLAPLFTDEEAG